MPNVELESSEVEPVRVRILPGEFMDTRNAALYVDRTVKTMAMWRLEGTGPRFVKRGSRVYYRKEDLDRYLGIDPHLEVARDQARASR